MRFPSRYVLLVIAPLALGSGCASRPLFKSSSGESAFSFRKKDKADAEETKTAGKDAKGGSADSKTAPRIKTPSERLSDDKLASSSNAGAPRDRLSEAKELEEKGDFDGAAKIYREILAEDKGAAKGGSLQTKVASTENKPAEKSRLAARSVAAKEKGASTDPWNDEMEPLPTTRPDGRKRTLLDDDAVAGKAAKTGSPSESAAEKKTESAEVAKSDNPWARRQTDPSTSASERAEIEAAMRQTDPEEIEELADILDLDADEEAPTVNKFAAREPQHKAEAPAEQAISADAIASDKPAWARSGVAEDAAGSPQPAEAARPNREIASTGGKQDLPFLDFGATADAEPKTETAEEPAWKATRSTAIAPNARNNDQFETPRAAEERELTSTEKSLTPSLGEQAEVAHREGWNRVSRSRLCRDCSPAVQAEAAKLDSSSPDVRKEGIVALARLGSVAQPACPALRTMLDDPDPIIQAHAAWALWELENDSLDSVQVLGGLLAHSRPEVVELACYSLGNIGTPAARAVPALVELRDQAYGPSQVQAAEAIIRVHGADVASVDVLTTAIKSENRQVRWMAASGLGHVRGVHAGRAVDTLVATLSDRDPEVQSAAALALGGMGAPALRALPELKQLEKSPMGHVHESATAAIKCLEKR
jgi:HEAT repeat protein